MADTLQGKVHMQRLISPLGLEHWVFVWEADSAGAASLRLGDDGMPSIVGHLERLETLPHETSPPTINYDVRLNSDFKLDLLTGAGNNRSATVAQANAIYNATPGGFQAVSLFASRPLLFKVVNAGNGGRGVAVIVVRPLGCPDCDVPPRRRSSGFPITG